MVTTYRIAVMAGDYAGPEVMAEALKVSFREDSLRTIAILISHIRRRQVLDVIQLFRPDIHLELVHCLAGGASLDARGTPLTPDTLRIALDSDAVLFGSVGGPKWGLAPPTPESALGQLRKELKAWGNLRPIYFAAPSLAEDCSPLKSSVCRDVSIMIIRELNGGVYYGERIEADSSSSPDYASDTDGYHRFEIERIARLAGTLAMQHDPPLQVTSLDKANVLAAAGRFWRRTVGEVMEKEFPKVELKHLLIDTAAMMMVKDPRSLNGVVLTSNMFGDIISDEASVIPGSLGLLPTASLCGITGLGCEGGRVKGLYEPIHGSAPDIAGKNIVNPVGMILSAAMMLRYSLAMAKEGLMIEKAVCAAIEAGVRTRDIGGWASTEEFGNATVHWLLRNH